MAGKQGNRPAAQAQKLHHQRNGVPLRNLDVDDREVVEFWLKNLPEYRAVIQERVNKAIKERAERITLIEDRHQRSLDTRDDWLDVDKLGPEIDPCG